MKMSFQQNRGNNQNKSKRITKNHSAYYQKLYAIKPDDIEESKEFSKEFQKRKKAEEEKSRMNSLMRVFAGPKKTVESGIKWSKVTKPKLPFKRIKIDQNLQRQKIEELKPSRLYHDFHTIHWLRKKYSESVVEKSVFSIFNERGKVKEPANEDEKTRRRRKMVEYLESFKGPIGREKYVKINPKYFFNQTNFAKMQKIKEVFLQFVGNGYRKMEMNELASLFNKNNIQANVNELAKLFLNDATVVKNDDKKLYLNFYQFLTFA